MQNLNKPLKGINIIGIDPSLTSAGLVIIMDGEIIRSCTIKTNTKMSYGDRIVKLGKGAEEFGLHMRHIRIEAIAVELPYIGRIKGNSCLKVAEARGALIGGLATCFKSDYLPPIMDITAIEAKKAVGVDTPYR